MRPRHFLTRLISLCLFLGAVVEAQNTEDSPSAVQVSDVEWGFDGTVRGKTFIPLNLNIKNPGDQGQDLTLRLLRSDGLSDVSEEYRQQIHVSGGITRRVQFLPFINDAADPWILRWGDGDDEMLELRTQGADDGVACLVSSNDPTATTGAFPRLDEERFPTSVQALDGLRILVLDHEPVWTQAQKKACEDWVRLGGRIVLLKPTGGDTIPFGPGLEFLNHVDATTPWGAGRVNRIDIPAREFQRSTIERHILGRRLSQGDLQHKLEMFERNGQTSYDRSQVLGTLKELAAFSQRWWLIYLIIFFYVGYQCRVGARYGILLKNPRGLYLRMVTATVVASIVICVLSRVGFRNANRIRTAAIARPVSPGVYDVEGWATLSTGLNGGIHQFAVMGDGPVYGAGESYGQSPVRVTEQGCEIDQPAFATQKMAYRIRANLPDIRGSLDSEDLQSTLLAALRDSSRSPRIHEAALLTGSSLLRLRPTNTPQGFQESRSSHQMADWVREQTARQHNRRRLNTLGMLGSLIYSLSDEERYQIIFDELLGNAYRVGVNVYPDSFVIPPGYARLVLMTDWPKELAFAGDYPDIDGRMLYVIDVPLRSTE